jgi:hypothetical protein
MPSMDIIKSVGAGIATVVTAGLAIWWLAVVWSRLGMEPKVNQSGAVVLDEYARAKDILLVVMPLFTASLAYWTGARGTTEAKEEAKEAKEESNQVTKQLDAVLDSSPEGVLQKAKQDHPEAFAAGTGAP